jgi:serine/threonine protein kinase
VWLALDETVHEHVALKLLPEDVADNIAGLRDMEREVKKTQFLNHPNIVRIGGLWNP